MDSNSGSTVMETIYGDLQRELGRQPIKKCEAPDGPLAYCHPGAEHPLLIFFHSTPMGAILRIDAPVAAKADWSSPGLSELLLREQSDWLFGRAERSGEGVVIEHCLRADSPPDQLASVVIGLADTALHLRYDLARMGGLTILEEAA